MPVIRDIHRPDVGGVPPKMLAICEQTKEALDGLTPYMRITTDDNIMSDVVIRGTFDPQGHWYNGIFQNGLYFIIFIRPEKGKRYYAKDDKKVTVELSNASHKLQNPKMRKYTGSVEKVLAKIVAWIGSNKVSNQV